MLFSAVLLSTVFRAFALTAFIAMAGCSSEPQLHGTVPSPAPRAANFTLTGQNGEPFSLSQTRGQVVALYFGFTHCKDVCPQTLALLGKARERSGLAAQQARIVMVTVDPSRDTPAALRAFFAKVGVAATGLTGTPAQLRPVYHAYGIAVQPKAHDIVHTDAIVIIGREGLIRELLDPSTPVADIAGDLRALAD